MMYEKEDSQARNKDLVLYIGFCCLDFFIFPNSMYAHSLDRQYRFFIK